MLTLRAAWAVIAGGANLAGHQFQSPNKCMMAGTRNDRTTNVSNRTAKDWRANQARQTENPQPTHTHN